VKREGGKGEETKISRMSGSLRMEFGQYVGDGGDRIFERDEDR